MKYSNVMLGSICYEVKGGDRVPGYLGEKNDRVTGAPK